MKAIVLPRLFLAAMLSVTACSSGKDSDGDGDNGTDDKDAAKADTAGTSPFGGACTTLADCASGATECNSDPGGQCTKPCNTQADCDGAPGAVCETDRPGNCYKACTSKADCPRDGYDCIGGPNAEGKKWCDVIPPASDAGTD